MKKTVCGFCGVGCSMVVKDGVVSGDREYPVNRGMLCAKGVSSIEAVHSGNRLLYPQMRETLSDSFVRVDWDSALSKVARKIASTSPGRVALYLSGQMGTEDYYIANKLGKGFIGTPHVDTNSRTCMASAVAAYKKSFGVDFVPVRIEDIGRCDLLLLAGANPAESHVVLWNIIKKERKRGLKVVVIDPRRTPSAEGADLHLPIEPGSDIDLFNLMARRIIEEGRTDDEFISKHLEGYEEYREAILASDRRLLLERTGLSEELFEEFAGLFLDSENIVSAWTMGLNQSVQGTDKNLSLIALHLITGRINREGNGPFSLTGQPNAMGGREVGALATMLAVHLDYDEEARKRVSSFWKSDSIPEAPGLSALEIFEAAERGEIDILVICHTDPIYHLPNRERMQRAISKVSLVVEINAYDDSETASFAHIRLPATPWGEKNATQTNLDRTITRQNALFPPSGEARHDWEIFCEIGRRLGYGEAFGYSGVEEIFEEYAEMTRLSGRGHLNIYDCDYEKLAKEPFVWGEGFMRENRFMREGGKAGIFFVENRRLHEKCDDRYPLILITGRTRDQWHSGTKTAGVERLRRYKALEFIEIHPDDARRFSIDDSQMVRVRSARGSVELPAKITESVGRGRVFIPLSVRGVNYLTSDLKDPVSKEPDYKYAAVSLERLV